jgi:hypothetical protein
MRHRSPLPFARLAGGEHPDDRFSRGSLLQCVCRQRTFVTCPGIIETAGFREQLLQERCGLTVRKLRCELGLEMAEFGTYPLGQQVRYRRGNVSFTTMTAAIKTWGAHTEPPKHRTETTTPIILQVAPTMTAGTRPQSFAVPLQLFADHKSLVAPENWFGVRELQTTDTDADASSTAHPAFVGASKFVVP